MSVNIQIRNKDGTYYSLVRKDHIKCLGVMIDDFISWKYDISYIRSRISRNIGIISKLRHFLSVKQLKANLLQLNLSLHLICNFGLGYHL